MVGEEHDGDPGQLPDPPLEVLVAGGHDVGLVLGHPVHQAIVGVSALVQAGQPLEPGREESGDWRVATGAQIFVERAKEQEKAQEINIRNRFAQHQYSESWV